MFGLLENDKKRTIDSKCLFEKICKKKIFSPITFFLVGHIFSDNKTINTSVKIALGYIFEISLNGFLYLRIENGNIFPKLSSIIHQKQISIETEIISQIERKIIEGADKIPQEFIHKIKNQTDIFPIKPFCKIDNRFYLQRNWIFESQFFHCLNEKKKNIPTGLYENVIDEKTQKYIKTDKISCLQANAIHHSLKKSFSMICGGPGCGKTYSILYLIKIFFAAWKKNRKPNVILAAPTGKATQKLEEAVVDHFKLDKGLIKTMTLHSLLKIKKDESKFLEKKFIDADLIIVDEASMIDIRLMALLLKGASWLSRLVLIGDPYQLPPIETEGIFSILAKKHVNLANVSFLTEAFRFENKKLLLLSEGIKDQNIDKVMSLLKEKTTDVEFISMDVDNNKEILEKVFKNAEKHYLFSNNEEINIDNVISKMFSFRILSCLKKGPLGSDDINDQCKQYFLNKTIFGDRLIMPIIITQNDYQLNLYNGTLGYLIKEIKNEILNETGQEKGYFSKKKIFPLFMLPQYEYSYCLSVHKSQGSEFDHVMLFVPSASDVFSKEILYTAVTRARKKLTIFSKEKTLINLIKKSSF